MRRRLLLRRFVGLWGIMSFLGCGSVSEQAPVRPLRGQSEERQLLDMRECEPPDKRGAIRLEAIRRYAACMISRGYRAYVEVELIDVQDNLAFPGGLLSFEVQAGAAVTAYPSVPG